MPFRRSEKLVIPIGRGGSRGEIFNHNPSTITNRQFADCSRIRFSGAYSGEAYQALSEDMVGNSNMTMRRGDQSPSKTSKFPPRTTYLPPYAVIVPFASLLYSSNPSGSVTSMSAIKKAVITRLSFSFSPQFTVDIMHL